MSALALRVYITGRPHIPISDKRVRTREIKNKKMVNEVAHHRGSRSLADEAMLRLILILSRRIRFSLDCHFRSFCELRHSVSKVIVFILQSKSTATQ